LGLTPKWIIKDNIAHRRLGGNLVNETHKGHNIIVSASRSAGMRQWKSHVKIIWSEDGKGKVSTLDVNGVFGARREAEMGGLTFAKKWIDDGKPRPLTTDNAQKSSNACHGAAFRRIDER
jgi:hypothetical protein